MRHKAANPRDTHSSRNGRWHTKLRYRRDRRYRKRYRRDSKR